MTEIFMTAKASGGPNYICVDLKMYISKLNYFFNLTTKQLASPDKFSHEGGGVVVN